MIRKSGHRFPEKIMLKQKDRAERRFNEKSSRSGADLSCDCFVWLFGEPNPDKVMTRPYLGREAVCFSSILHDELKGRSAAAG
jgi:hypothetical protein